MIAEPLNKKQNVLEKNNTEIVPFYFESDVASAVAWLKDVVYRRSHYGDIDINTVLDSIDEAFKDVIEVKK
jgi:hypothetical protein